MSMRSVAVSVALALALVSAGSAAARPAATHTKNVKVTAKDFSFVLSTKTVAHGRVTFDIVNSGHAMHDFEIAGHRSRVIGPGKRTTLSVTLKAGRYPYKCTVDDHASLGMKGTLHVT
jgi:plastocyanin